MEKRRIAIVGATGSIGTQALDVIRQHKDKFQVELISANSNYELLARQAAEFDVNNVVICDEKYYNPLKEKLEESDSKVFAGMESLCELVKSHTIDIVLISTVGFSGLKPTIEAIKANKIIALANKETLVAAGELIMGMIARHGTAIIPVDSEHSAIFQCLQGHPARIAKIHLTASGGPFRTMNKEQIASVSCHDALKHPKWNMGAKITIDSATMMNKGFEFIEAKWLFGVHPDTIDIVVHPQSIVHSMVEFEDGAILAQLGYPDMREPIQYALAYPERLPLNNKKIDFCQIAKLDFHKPDFNKFPCLKIALDSIRKGGNIPCAVNAANEVAVAAFLAGKIGFYDINKIIDESLKRVDFIEKPDMNDIFATNEETIKVANDILINI